MRWHAEPSLLSLAFLALVAFCAGTGRPACDPAICGQDPLTEPDDEADDGTLCRAGNTYVASENPELPWLRYLDGQLSLSNSCGVFAGNKLNCRIPPMYVNGQPVGFC